MEGLLNELTLVRDRMLYTGEGMVVREACFDECVTSNVGHNNIGLRDVGRKNVCTTLWWP